MTTHVVASPLEVYFGKEEEAVEVVEKFERLGSTITQDCSLDRDVDRWISKALHIFCQLYGVM